VTIDITDRFIRRLASDMALPEVSQLTAGIDDNNLLLITAHYKGVKGKVFLCVTAEQGIAGASRLVIRLAGVSLAKLNLGLPGGLVEHLTRHLIPAGVRYSTGPLCLTPGGKPTTGALVGINIPGLRLAEVRTGETN
jgi:hypothetical protein